MSDYAYDAEVLDEVARRLYAALPAIYRLPDEPPAGHGDLAALLEVLAVPLAVLHQSIDELHADLFIDTAADQMIPYLAAMVGTSLVFPDADSNRRDVRGTVGWRRRKGTPAALQEMGDELTGQSVVVQEGWKRIQLTQDLDLLRPERVLPDIRPAVVAEQATGPLDALFHVVDVRPVTATTGRYHPQQVAHWLQPTVTFPLQGATPVDRTLPGSDIRYAMHPLGVRQPLRARRTASDTRPFVDRILEQHFAAQPELWFAAPGGFDIRVCGVDAAIAGNESAERVPSGAVAGPELGQGNATLTALDLPTRGWRGPIRIELGLAAVTGTGTGSWQGDGAGMAVRSSIDLDSAGVVGSATAGSPAPTGTVVPMLRLTPLAGAPGRFFPGATLEIAGAAPGATAAAVDSELAREGFLRGTQHVTIPPLVVHGTRCFYVAADGSLYDAAAEDGTQYEMPELSGLRLAPTTLLSPGPGAAWPPLLPRSEPQLLTRVAPAPGRGPAVLHGGLPLERANGAFADLPPVTSCALAFAVQRDQPGGPDFTPFQRLAWTGSNPGSGTWAALDGSGNVVGAPDTAAVFAGIAELRAENPDAVALAVRFECSDGTATLCPSEVAWSSDDGTTVLVHLPQLDVAPLGADPPWSDGGTYGFASESVRVAEDGSTWAAASSAVRRSSLGAVAPIAEASGLRRRRVHGRRLCAWDNEDWSTSPPQTLALTQHGRLDVDVEHGLFAFAAEEPLQVWPTGPDGAVPPNVTVDYEEGATAHVGALPAAREPVLDVQLPRPTRLVSRSGALHADSPADWHSIPRYTSLGDALAAIAARWNSLTVTDAGDVVEVVQFEDSATYPGEQPVWPAAPADPSARAAARLSLTIQAAERERPTILVDPVQGWTLPGGRRHRYTDLTLLGIAIGPDDWTGMRLPATERTAIQLCSVLGAASPLHFADHPAGTAVTVTRCETAGLRLAGTGLLAVSDSIVDADAAIALRADVGEIAAERVSVGGAVRVRVLEASETIFDGPVAVQDRFHGCLRYSRVSAGSVLPRTHRVTVDTPVRVVSRNRRDPAWWRLRPDCDAAIARGAEAGSEIGAFNETQSAQRVAGFERRLGEFTPVGLMTGVIRID
jgi:hypothetical protein